MNDLLKPDPARPRNRPRQETGLTIPANATMRLLPAYADVVISPRENTKLWTPDPPGAKVRNEAVRSSNDPDQALWRQLSGYYRRSRVETKMQCVKVPDQRLSTRDFNRQVAAIQIRAAILKNGLTALAIPRAEAAG